MSITKNVAGQQVSVFAYDTVAQVPKTGDAANITAQVSKDGGVSAASNDVNPTELDATDHAGIYVFGLAQAESNANMINWSAVSSTGNIVIEPVVILTDSARAGTGADQVTINIKKGGVNQENVQVWISTDSAGDEVYAGTLLTDSDGDRLFLLDADSTYYLWAQKGGLVSITGESFVAATAGNDFTMTAAAAGTGTTLLAVRKEFVAKSGRHNLVTDFAGGDYSDNGADIYLNKAQRDLDGRVPHPFNLRRVVKDVAVDDRIVEIDKPRYIHEVFLNVDSDGSKVELKRKKWEELWPAYSDTTTSGAPKYYAIGTGSPAPEIESGFDPTAHEGAFDMPTDSWNTKVRLLLNVPASVAYTMHIIAQFYTPDLSGDSDVSFWTANHPHTLVLAACYQLELAYRNMTGARGWLEAVERELFELEKDIIESQLDDDRLVVGG